MTKVRSILSFTLAALVLVSSTNFMVGMHFCSGEIQNIALFTKAERCEMEMTMPPCHRHETSSCCDDETVVHQGEDFSATATEITMPPAYFVVVELPSVILKEIIPSAGLSEVKFFNYDSPLRASDLTVALQVFLI